MRHVVTYDIGDDRARERVAKVLSGFGWRVQESVFECDVTEDDLELLVERLQEELPPEVAGSIRLYRLCTECQRAARGLGVQPSLLGDNEAVVL